VNKDIHIITMLSVNRADINTINIHASAKLNDLHTTGINCLPMITFVVFRIVHHSSIERYFNGYKVYAYIILYYIILYYIILYYYIL